MGRYLLPRASFSFVSSVASYERARQQFTAYKSRVHTPILCVAEVIAILAPRALRYAITAGAGFTCYYVFVRE